MATLIVVVGVPAAEGDAPPLHTLRPGAPGEPRWTVLSFELPQMGRISIDTQVWENYCPMMWGFALYVGPDAEHRRATVIFDWANGQTGVEASAVEPISIDTGVMIYDGQEHCGGGFGPLLNFLEVPAGRAHLLAFTAGETFFGEGIVTASPGTSLIGVATGDSTHYVRGGEFQGGQHLGVHSPGVCTSPNADPGSGFCDVCCNHPGDTFGGFDASVDREARLSFQARPFYYFGNSFTTVEVANFSVTDPLGFVSSNPASTATVAGLKIRQGSQGIWSMDAPRSGEYVYRIEGNANIGALNGVQWRIGAADFHLSGETG